MQAHYMATSTAATAASAGVNPTALRLVPNGRVGGPQFHGALSGRQNLKVLAASRGPLSASVDAALAAVDLTDRADDPVHTYSPALRRRLARALSLLLDPSGPLARGAADFASAS